VERSEQFIGQSLAFLDAVEKGTKAPAVGGGVVFKKGPATRIPGSNLPSKPARRHR